MGLRVLELAGLGPAPFAAMLLADMGAEVLRVERPDAASRAALPARFDVLNRSRRSAVLDLRHPDGRAALLAMVGRADALIEGFRPGVAERLGVGPQDCWERNPALVYARMTGWGQDGPWSMRAGHDIGYVALTGALHAIGRAGGPPQVPLNLLGDFGGGATYLATGVLAAVWQAARSGRGQVVDAAIVDGTASLTALVWGMRAAGMWHDERGTNLLDTGYPGYDVYRTADGKWLAAGPLEEQFFAEFLAVLDITDAPPRTDPAGWPALRKRIAGRIAERSRAEWDAAFADTDACVSPVLTFAEAAEHPQLVARGTFVDIAGVRQPAPAPRFSATPTALPTPPAEPGAHTREALADWGVPDVESLIERGVALQTG